jgi:hypothetical protein
MSRQFINDFLVSLASHIHKIDPSFVFHNELGPVLTIRYGKNIEEFYFINGVQMDFGDVIDYTIGDDVGEPQYDETKKYMNDGDYNFYNKNMLSLTPILKHMMDEFQKFGFVSSSLGPTSDFSSVNINKKTGHLMYITGSTYHINGMCLPKYQWENEMMSKTTQSQVVFF